MPDQPARLDPLRAHAAHVDVLRSRVERARIAGERIATDQSAYGALCGRILAGPGDRYLFNRSQVAFIEESLRLVVRALGRVADGEQEFADWLGEPVAYDRSQSLSHLLDEVIDWIKDREWVEPGLAEAAPVAEFAAPVGDGFTVLRAAGLRCATARIEPVGRLLDDLAGAPEVVADQARRWETMAADLHAVGADLRHRLDQDFAGSDRPGAAAYLALMSNNVEALMGVAATATAMALITRSAGDLILLTRDIVRGLLGDLFARVITWVTDTSAVVPLPLLAARLATVVATVWRIEGYLTALVTSVANLSDCIRG